MDEPTSAPTTDLGRLHRTLLRWYARHRRDLPWRAPSSTAWGVLVSEVMLQQTPVSRVLPAWTEWLTRWPTPADLAAETPGTAVAAWGRLGYPRRALRLHAAAQECVRRHGGAVPATYAELRALPGVGDYTAAAVAAFAFRQRHVVLDTNVRRVLARLLAGTEFEPPGAPSAVERARAESLLPADPDTSATWNVSLMELGAVICTARAPRCDTCPVRARCAWVAAGSPSWGGPPRRGQAWHGTDRQARGALMAIAREAYAPGHGHLVTRAELAAAWPDTAQRERALASLLADGLLEHTEQGYRLPSA